MQNRRARHQGPQFFPDKPRAAAEMRRALAEGGRLAIATWRSDAEIPFFRQLREIAERRLGPIADPRYRYGDPAPIEALLRDAGFHGVRSRKVSRTIRLDEGSPFLQLNAMALVGMSAPGKSADDRERMRLVETIARNSASVAGRYAERITGCFRSLHQPGDSEGAGNGFLGRVALPRCFR